VLQGDLNAASHRKRVAALLNVSAGTIEREGETAFRATLTSAFQQSGISATLEFLPGADLAAAAARALRLVLDRELDAVVVGGGDGSVRTVASVLAGSGAALGILPLGTLNHFAKELGIPTTVEGAIGVIATETARCVDLGEVNGEVFINNSSIGFYPYLVFERERERRRQRLSKWAAMILAGLRVLRHLPLFRLRVRVEGVSELIRSPCVFVGNNEYHLTLRAFGRRERLDRGELCLYAAKAQHRLALLWLACRSILGFVDQQRDLRIFKGGTAEISSRRHWLLVAIDGEIKTMRSPLQYRSRPAALRVLAPAATHG
jgi:diacylglycerol kinase family enzyme